MGYELLPTVIGTGASFLLVCLKCWLVLPIHATHVLPDALVELMVIWAACCQVYSHSLSCGTDTPPVTPFVSKKWQGQHLSKSREIRTTSVVSCICVWQLFTIYSYHACTYEVQNIQVLSTSILLFPQFFSQQRYTHLISGWSQRLEGINFQSTLCSESVLNKQRLLIQGPHSGHAKNHAEYRDESLTMPGLVYALHPMWSNTTISSAVSALVGFEAAYWNVKVLGSGEDTCRDVRKVMQTSARCCSCRSSNLSQLKCTRQLAHILSLRAHLREVCN